MAGYPQPNGWRNGLARRLPGGRPCVVSSDSIFVVPLLVGCAAGADLGPAGDPGSADDFDDHFHLNLAAVELTLDLIIYRANAGTMSEEEFWSEVDDVAAHLRRLDAPSPYLGEFVSDMAHRLNWYAHLRDQGDLDGEDSQFLVAAVSDLIRARRHENQPSAQETVARDLERRVDILTLDLITQDEFWFLIGAMVDADVPATGGKDREVLTAVFELLAEGHRRFQAENDHESAMDQVHAALDLLPSS